MDFSLAFLAFTLKTLANASAVDLGFFSSSTVFHLQWGHGQMAMEI